jgi:galactokinase
MFFPRDTDMDDAVSLAELAARTAETFRGKFHREPTVIAAAPGRVNLIGEHTDYNDGFVLPMAIDRYTVVAADQAAGASGSACVASSTVGDAQQFALDGNGQASLPTWAKYVQCVIDRFAATGVAIPAFDAVIDSAVPLGGGLSSSAALEVAIATMLETITGKKLEPVLKALLCQAAEHKVGVPCGIMDQFSSVLCQAGHLMLLDCRSQVPRMVPLADASVTVLVINSNVKHELTGGEYAERRAQCEQAARSLGVASLRDATTNMLEQHREQLDPVIYRRARHVIGEIERTTSAAAALEAGDWQEVGRLMYASHASLRDDYEVSCAELDALVAAATSLGEANGVYGSRMTGGGFGGCTVSLVRTDRAAAVAEAICRHYQQQIGVEATAFATPPAQGACVLSHRKC